MVGGVAQACERCLVNVAGSELNLEALSEEAGDADQVPPRSWNENVIDAALDPSAASGLRSAVVAQLGRYLGTPLLKRLHASAVA